MRNSASKVLILSVLLRIFVVSLAVALPSDKSKTSRSEVKLTKANRAYSFIKYAENKLYIPDSTAMGYFYTALDSLRNGTRQKVNVVHIGDSHIQADLFSGRVRTLMQDSSAFGNGGRGLVFPYPLAKTNNPWNYKVTYTGAWTGCRNVQYQQTCSWGLAGITAETIDSSATFTVQNGSVSGNYQVNKVRVFYPVTDKTQFLPLLKAADSVYFPVTLDSLGFAQFELPYEIDQITILLTKTNASQYHFTLQGLTLENDRPGLQYSSLGVNGAEVISFLRNPDLETNLQALNPDLIIISLGTNDAYGKTFNPELFKQNLGTLLQRLKRAAPHASILLTAPGDNYRQRKYANYNNLKATLKMYELAEETNCAVWNFYKVMGGLKSVVKWQYNGLAAKDRVHLTAKGYKFQGDLLFEALMEAYLND